jgi:hypothetical protein
MLSIKNYIHHHLQNNILLIVIFCIVSGCKDSPSKNSEYYDNGLLKKSVEVDNSGIMIITRYDSLGRIESKRNFNNGEYVGSYTDYVYTNDLEGEILGHYSNGIQIKEYEKYFDNKSGLLHSEVHFIVVDSFLIDNSHKMYDNKGNLQDEFSCYVNFHTASDTLKLNHICTITLDCPCLELDSSIMFIGDFDDNYHSMNQDIDTIKFFGNSITYNFSPKSKGTKKLYGIIRKFKHNLEDGTFISKDIYFKKLLYVN